MKSIFVIFLFLNLGIFLNAQEVDNPRFHLPSLEVKETLQLQTSPVNTTNIKVAIYTAEDKMSNAHRINEALTMHRGKASHHINVASLPSGDYYIEIFQKGKGVIFRKKFNKN